MATFLTKGELNPNYAYVQVNRPDSVGIVYNSPSSRYIVYDENDNFRRKDRGRRFPIPKWVREGLTAEKYLRLDKIDVAPDGHPIFRGKISEYIIEEEAEKKAFYSEHYKFGEFYDERGQHHHREGIIAETKICKNHYSSEEDGKKWIFSTNPETEKEFIPMPEGFHGKDVEKSRERKPAEVEVFHRGPLYDEPDFFLRETRRHFREFITRDSYHVKFDENGKLVEIYDGEETVQAYKDDFETTKEKLRVVSTEILKEWVEESSWYEHDEDGKQYYKSVLSKKMVKYHFDDGTDYTQIESEPVR